MKRGRFLELTAAAAAGSGMIGAAPVTSEDDPEIAVQHVKIRRPDVFMPAYFAQPRRNNPATPCVVVVMHAWGVDESIREVVRRFAKAGFAAIAPDLYARYNAPAGDGVSDFAKFRPYVERLSAAPDLADGDVRASALSLKVAHPQAKVGVTGFCLGGGIALRQTVTSGEVFAADAVWYGRVAGIDAAKIHMPLAGSYGERDTSIPAESVRAFEAALRVPNDIVIYPSAGHAFFDDHRASYVPAAAEDSWRRTIAFFTKYLNA